MPTFIPARGRTLHLAGVCGNRIGTARAAAALRDIERAQTLGAIETAWSDFLIAAGRLFSRLEQGAKTNSQSEAWFGRKKHERRTIPMLTYIHHARNADEHGLAKVTDRTVPGIALGVGPGAWRFDGTLGPSGQMRITALGGQVPGVSKFVEAVPSKVPLIRVMDRGVSYDPPLDLTSTVLLPNEVAARALTYLQQMIEQARQLPD
jgi:hypothetical protein